MVDKNITNLELDLDAQWLQFDELYQRVRSAIESLPSGGKYDDIYRDANAAAVQMSQLYELLVDGSRAAIETLTDQRDEAVEELSRLEEDLENPHRYYTQSTRLMMDERVRDCIANILEEANEEFAGNALSLAYTHVLSELSQRLAQILNISPETANEVIQLAMTAGDNE